MNEDFGLSYTPGIARRLQILSRTGGIMLSEELNTLATEGGISEKDFDAFACPMTPTRKQVTQFLLDCDLRGIVQRKIHPEIAEVVICNAIRLKKPSHLTIFTQRRDVWRNAAKAMFLDDITSIRNHYQMTGEEIERDHGGVLLVDFQDNIEPQIAKLRDFSREFPSTIIYETFTGMTPWPLFAMIMFPTMPSPLLPRITSHVTSVWQDVPLHMFAPFYNACIFPELITDAVVLDEISDKRSQIALQHYRHLLV
jgi:hypothetical protein